MSALSRADGVRIAEAAQQSAAWQLPDGAQLVVVVTDEEGEWCGVSSNVGNERTAAILASALAGAGRSDGQPKHERHIDNSETSAGGSNLPCPRHRRAPRERAMVAGLPADDAKRDAHDAVRQGGAEVQDVLSHVPKVARKQMVRSAPFPGPD
jgi:hypothetical protein